MASQSSSQQGPADRPIFRAGVELIQLDVSVLDRDRKPITGLNASDFTILEDGIARPIRAFAPVVLPARAGSESRPSASPVRDRAKPSTNASGNDEGRLVIILMDRTIPVGEPTVTARRIATAGIDELGPHDLAAVVTTGSGVPQALTADRARLIAAVNRGDWSTGISKEQEDIVARVMGKDDPLSDGRCLCGLCVLETVTGISDAVKNVSRRKKVLLFIGSSVIFQVGPRAPSADVGCSRRVTDAQRTLFDSLALSNLTVHSLDPAGIVSIGAHTRAGSPGGRTMDAPARRRQQLQQDTADSLQNQGSLQVLPDLTGGRAVLNTNAPDEQVPAILDESGAYYLLAFEPGPARRGPPRRMIDVKVARRGASVVAQRKHILPSVPGIAAASGGALAPASPLDDALRSLLPVATKPLTLSVAAFAAPEPGRAVLSLTVDVTAFGSAGTAVPLEIGAIAVDQRGRRVVSARQRTTVEMPRVAPGPEHETNVVIPLELPHGDYEIRVAVSDAAGVAASVSSQVAIPAFGTAVLSLSDVSLEMGRASTRTPATGAVQNATTRRSFHPGEDVRAFLEIYQGPERMGPVVP
ncbi:MAG: VWA domain-containing protein, partial [Vicinamibacterales bacterium]